MIEKFKGVTATKQDWEASSKILPKEVWAIVVFEGTISAPISVGIKIGVGLPYSTTPFIYNPDNLKSKIDKPSVEEPSTKKFLSETGDYIEIDLENSLVTLDNILSTLSESDYQLTTKAQIDWIESQMYTPPAFSSFSSSSNFIGKVAMGTVIQGLINFTWAYSNPDNIQRVSISVSEGTWDKAGDIINFKSTKSIGLTTSTPITSKSIKTVKFSLTGVDIKGNTISKRELSISFTHKIYYGTSTTRDITSFGDIQGIKSILSNSREHTMEFVPIQSQYSVIAIPQEIDQNNINIVNSNAPSINHSFNMNEGEGGTVARGVVVDNDIAYNVYVSYGPSLSKSTAIIK